MNLDKLVKERLMPVVSDLDFWVAYEGKDCVRLENRQLIIRVVHNQMDGTTYGSLRKRGGQDHSLEFGVFQEYFGFSLPPERTAEVFIETLVLAFGTDPGRELINGHIENFEIYSSNAQARYWAEIKRQQWTRDASEAWQQEDFRRFLEILEKVDKKDLSKSYLLKLKIAKKRVSLN